ncbi:MAG: AMP-dependent synthetase [Gammaproteobacteria bacterium BRH_c0]|nr:MAG: AMP-dependent synthetase [Gammaproteobacteria bacterium BRH_c0]
MHSPLPLSFADDLERHALWHTNHPAYVQGDQRISHGELLQRAKQLGSALYQAGVRHQDRVGILAHNSIAYGEVIAACQWSGFILSTVNFRLAAAEMAWIINDAMPSVLFFEAHYLAVIAELRPILTSVTTFVCMDGEADWAINYDSFIASGDPHGPPCKGREEDPCCLIYTSGTTGRPKGCLWGQRELRHIAQLDACYANLQQPDRILIVMPMFHIGGLVLSLSQHGRGGTAYLYPHFDAEAIINAIEKDRLTVLLLAPTMVQMLLATPGIEQRDLSSVRTILYSAAPMPSTLLLRAIEVFRGCDFVNLFGQTEVVPCALTPQQHRPLGTDQERKQLLSIGQPYPNMEVKVIDENGADCPDGVAGELLARGVAMFRGYWNNSVASASTLRNGWVHTGDVARIEDGFIYLVDRKKDVIISGGENIYSREVEEAVLQHHAVSECAAIGIPDEKWLEIVCAVVVLKNAAPLTAEDLIEHTRQLLASYKKPRKVIFVDELPKLVTGKIDKKALRKHYS